MIRCKTFFELALYLILFELGLPGPRCAPDDRRSRLMAGCATPTGCRTSGIGAVHLLGLYARLSILRGNALIATSPAITIATCSDIGIGTAAYLEFSVEAAIIIASAPGWTTQLLTMQLSRKRLKLNSRESFF